MELNKITLEKCAKDIGLDEPEAECMHSSRHFHFKKWSRRTMFKPENLRKVQDSRLCKQIWRRRIIWNHKQPRLAAEGHTEVSGNLGRSLPLRSDEAEQNCKRKQSGPHTEARLDISYPRAGGKLSLFFYLQELSRTLNSGQSVPF